MEEHFDVCDPEGRPTGQSLPRGEVHRRGLWHRSSHLWLTDGSRLLLQKRHPDKETDPGRWDIAVAGHLSAGQTPLEALVREAFEELGLRLEPWSLEFLTARPKEYLEARFIDREWQHLYAGRWSGNLGELVLQPDEVVDARWMTMDEYGERIEARDDAYVDRRDDWEPFAQWFNRR